MEAATQLFLRSHRKCWVVLAALLVFVFMAIQIDSISKSSSLALSRPDSVLRTHFDYIVENIGGG